ncbi:MAG: CPBP family glutamic-type intramembrane protease [Candidatus Latescibacterota bacterium]|jgi:membrane protease YdiL (CAAX protease family)
MEYAYPRLGQILRVALPALFVAQFIVWPMTGFLNPHLGIVATELVIIWFMAFYIRRSRFEAENLLLFNATPLPTLLIVFPTAIGASLLVAEFDLYTSALLRLFDLGAPLSLQRNLLEIQIVRDYSELPKVLFAVVFLPGICEELFFRGFVFTGLYFHYGPKTALFFSALLFAAAHFNPWQLPALFIFGLFLAALAYWTHSIYPPILAHIVNNMLSVLGINLRTNFGFDALASNDHLSTPLLALATLVSLGGLYLISRRPRIVPLPQRECR